MLQLLLEEQVDFILVGAYALAAHGYPRATGDIDIWVRADEINSINIYRALERFGAPVDQITVNDFANEGIVFQIGVTPRRIDIITHLDGVSFGEADEDKVIVKVEGLKLPILSFDKLIKNKLSTGRERDALDVKLLRKIKKP